jgi:hypothetical protein
MELDCSDTKDEEGGAVYTCFHGMDYLDHLSGLALFVTYQMGSQKSIACSFLIWLRSGSRI